MLGLKYIGKKEEGINVMLFRSYKSVLIRKHTPYRFTNKDKVTAEAENYYKSLRKLGLDIITDESDFGPIKKSAKRVQPVIDIPETKVEDKVEPETVTTPEEVVEEVVEAISTKVEVSELANMTNDELAEYLDLNFEKDQLKEIIETNNFDINTGRKNKSSLISEILESHKDQLVEYLSK